MTPRQALSEMFSLSPRQTDVLEYILAYIGKHGYPPTVREIGRRLGTKWTYGVYQHLKALHRKGAIEWQRGQLRTIRPKAMVMR